MATTTSPSVYVSAFSQIDELIYILDESCSLIDCSDKLLHFLGFNHIKEVSTKSIYDLLLKKGLWTSEQVSHYQEKDIQVIISGQKQEEEQALINSNGSVIYFKLSRNPLSDGAGNALGLAVSMRDVTELKQLHHQLKTLKKQLRYKLGPSASYNEETTTTPNPLKILIVEDNQIDQKAERGILMTFRCLTDIAASQQQAEEIFQPGKYDLVLMDLGLDQGNGYQLTALLRKKEQGSPYRVPIIALTGQDPETAGFECEDVEMDGILSKPLTVELAKQLIQHYVHHNQVNVKGLRAFKH